MRYQIYLLPVRHSLTLRPPSRKKLNIVVAERVIRYFRRHYGKNRPEEILTCACRGAHDGPKNTYKCAIGLLLTDNIFGTSATIFET